MAVSFGLVFHCSEVNAGFFYKSAEEREKLVAAERKFIEQRVLKVIELKKKVCNGTDKTFVLINQKVGYVSELFFVSIKLFSVRSVCILGY